MGASPLGYLQKKRLLFSYLHSVTIESISAKFTKICLKNKAHAQNPHVIKAQGSIIICH